MISQIKVKFVPIQRRSVHVPSYLVFRCALKVRAVSHQALLCNQIMLFKNIPMLRVLSLITWNENNSFWGSFWFLKHHDIIGFWTKFIHWTFLSTTGCLNFWREEGSADWSLGHLLRGQRPGQRKGQPCSLPAVLHSHPVQAAFLRSGPWTLDLSVARWEDDSPWPGRRPRSKRRLVGWLAWMGQQG